MVEDELFWCGFSVNGDDPEAVLQDFGSYAYQLMKAVSAMEERFGITAPILFLRGSVRQRKPFNTQQYTKLNSALTLSHKDLSLITI